LSLVSGSRRRNSHEESTERLALPPKDAAEALGVSDLREFVTGLHAGRSVARLTSNGRGLLRSVPGGGEG
jgi:hypothetical protein